MMFLRSTIYTLLQALVSSLIKLFDKSKILILITIFPILTLSQKNKKKTYWHWDPWKAKNQRKVFMPFQFDLMIKFHLTFDPTLYLNVFVSTKKPAINIKTSDITQIWPIEIWKQSKSVIFIDILRAVLNLNIRAIYYFIIHQTSRIDYSRRTECYLTRNIFKLVFQMFSIYS